MKIKNYNEHIRPKLEFDIGDWVKINSKHMGDSDYITEVEYYNFLNNNIGKVLEYDNMRVLVKFFDVPATLKYVFLDDKKSFKLSRVMDYAKNKKELEYKLRVKKDVNKYNL